MAKWIAVFAFCSVTVFAQSALPKASYDMAQEVLDNYRPTLKTAARKHAHKFESIRLIRIDDVPGGWARAQKPRFADGGTIDQIYGN